MQRRCSVWGGRRNWRRDWHYRRWRLGGSTEVAGSGTRVLSRRRNLRPLNRPAPDFAFIFLTVITSSLAPGFFDCSPRIATPIPTRQHIRYMVTHSGIKIPSLNGAHFTALLVTSPSRLLRRLLSKLFSCISQLACTI